MRVLLACRDAGAAQQLLAVAHSSPHLPEPAVGGIRVLAGEPAVSVFEAAGLPVTALEAANVSGIAEQFRSFRPQVVLTGVSAPGPSLEEAVTRVGRSMEIPVVAFQDYWGCGHDDREVAPDAWLVLDDQAARLTRAQYPHTPCEVVGSPRHDALEHRDFVAMQHGAVRRHEQGARAELLFAGQPLWHVPGYAATLKAVAAALRACPAAVHLRYAPHPAEAYDQAQVAGIFAAPSFTTEVRAMTEVIADLCEADLLITAYSSCAWDLLQLQRYAPRPPAAPVCIMTEPTIRAAHARHAGGQTVVPYADVLGDLLVTSPDALIPAIESALRAGTRSALASRVREAWPPHAPSATARVWSALARFANPD